MDYNFDVGPNVRTTRFSVFVAFAIILVFWICLFVLVGSRDRAIVAVSSPAGANLTVNGKSPRLGRNQTYVLRLDPGDYRVNFTDRTGRRHMRTMQVLDTLDTQMFVVRNDSFYRLKTPN